MCGNAGIVDLPGKSGLFPATPGVIAHRRPDADGGKVTHASLR